MKIRKLILLATFLFTSPQLSFAIDIAMYKKLRAETAQSSAGGTLRVYLKGLQDGIEWSDAFSKKQGNSRIFCGPESIALNVENYIQFIDEALRAPRDGALAETFPVALVLIQFLQVKMPCETK